MIKDNKSRAWKALKADLKRRGVNYGRYFTDMVSQAIQEARNHVAYQSQGCKRA